MRNDEYFKPGKPYVDEVEHIGITDDAARINTTCRAMVLAGGINPRARRSRSSRTPGYALFETKAGGYTDLVVRLDTQPTGNPDFVTALKYSSSSRSESGNEVYRNFAVIGNDEAIDPSNRYYDADWRSGQLIFDKAKFHFQKSGVGGSKLPIYGLARR